MTSLLIIDDDKGLTQLLSDYLSGQGYSVHAAENGRQGLRVIYETRPDIVLLDVTMPEKDGWEILERIREISSLPIIMLTARGDEADILHGFSLGADDYVTKPFSFAQLAARIHAVLARFGQENTQENRLSVGGLQVDTRLKRVWREGQPLTLTPTEFKLLVALMRHPGEVISAEGLVREVWGPQYASEIGFVRRYVWHLRQKIEPDPENPIYIHNDRGYGYRFGSVENS